MMMEITRALRYSYRPWPKGCSKSGFRSASLAPATVITEDSTSDRLFTASIRMAMELVENPTTALNPARSTLTPMPMKLVRRMMDSLRPFANEVPIRTSQPLSYRIAPIIAQMEGKENAPGVFLPNKKAAGTSGGLCQWSAALPFSRFRIVASSGSSPRSTGPKLVWFPSPSQLQSMYPMVLASYSTV